MKKILLILLFVVINLTVSAQQLSGKVFILGEAVKDCSIPTGDCDCCMSELFFVTEQQFVMIHHCGPGQTWMNGSYKVASKVLMLQFSQGSVYKSFDTGESTWEKTMIEPETYTLSSCENGTILLMNVGNSQLKYGLPIEWEKINEVLGSGEWKILRSN